MHNNYILIITECGSLDSPQYGSVTSTGKEFEAIATYSCQLGFEIEGAETATCKAEGEWSPGPPTCNRISKRFCFCHNLLRLPEMSS